MKKKSKQKIENKTQTKPLSKQQKWIFILITILIPVVLLIFFEIALRLGNYGGDLKLFIPSTKGYENYLRCNPDVARRYFFMQNTVPSPAKDLFLAEKSKDIFRIFVMGGSTTAGFPYGNNMMFSRILHKHLELKGDLKLCFFNVLKTINPNLVEKFQKLYKNGYKPDKKYILKIDKIIYELCTKYKIKNRI